MRLVAFAIVYLLAWFGALYGLPELAENELQLFMASHYAQTPFSLWDTRWYDGFNVAWRPPGFYVLAALSAPLIGVERAYALLVIATALAFVLMVGWLASELRPHTGGTASLLAAANPLVYLSVFTFGQAPFLAALTCALGIAGAGASYRKDGELPLLVATACLSVLAPLFHPLGWVLVVIAWIFVIWTNTERISLVATAIFSISLSVLALLPLLAAARSGGSGPVAQDKGFLVLSAVALFALGLFVNKRNAMVLAAGLVIASSYVLGDQSQSAPVRRYREALANIETVLSRPEAKDYRFLTIGLGSERLALSRRAKARLADGGIPWQTRTLRGTPLSVDSIDALSLGTTAGKETLAQVLRDAEGQSLRWIVVAQQPADALLQASGYRVAAAFSGGVVLWEKSVTALPQKPPQALPAFFWTVITPVAMLVMLLAFAATVARRRARVASYSLSGD